MLKDSNLEGLLGSIKTVEGELCLEEPCQQEGMFGRCNLTLALSVTPSSLPVFHEGSSLFFHDAFLTTSPGSNRAKPWVKPSETTNQRNRFSLKIFFCLFVCFLAGIWSQSLKAN